MNIESFQTPPKKQRPMVRWWWPGLDVTEEEIRKEIQEMDRCGLGGAEIQQFIVGLPEKRTKRRTERSDKVNRCMQPVQYEMFKAAIDEAKAHDMIIDITGTTGCAVGGDHIPYKHSLKTLFFGSRVVVGGKHTTIKVPKFKKLKLYVVLDFFLSKVFGSSMLEYVPEDKRLVRVTAGRLSGKKGTFTSTPRKKSTFLENDSLIDITDNVDARGFLHWDAPEGKWQIFAAYEGTSGHLAHIGTPKPTTDEHDIDLKLVHDYFNEEAVTYHYEHYLGPLEQLAKEDYGETVRAVFTDSIEMMTPMHWTDTFIDEFKERRGYDISPYLPLCYIPLKAMSFFTMGHEIGRPNFDFENGHGERIRYDYQKTLSELFVDNYAKKLDGWCRERKLQSRVQGYGALTDNLALMGYSAIPETEHLYAGGVLNFLKIAGAAGTLYERHIVTCETMGWIPKAYKTTPQKWRIALDKLYESGVNQAIYHGYPYDYPYIKNPSYHPFASAHLPAMNASSDFSKNNRLLFDAAPTMNAYAGRMQHIMQKSRTKTSVAVFYQLIDYPNGNYVNEELLQGHLESEDGPLTRKEGLIDRVLANDQNVRGDRLWAKETAALGADMVKHGYYYMYVNEDRLTTSASIDRGRLIVGEAEFEAVIVYKERAVPLSVVKRLKTFAEAGGTVIIYGDVPMNVPGFKDYPRQEQELATLMRDMDPIQVTGNQAVIDTLHERAITKEVVYTEPQDTIGFIHKKDRHEDIDYYFFRNRQFRDYRFRVRLPTRDKKPIVFDAWSGHVTLFANYETDDLGVSLDVRLTEYGSILIGLVKDENAENLSVYKPDYFKADTTLIKNITGFAVKSAKRKADGSVVLLETTMHEPVDLRTVQGFEYVSSISEYAATFTVDRKDQQLRYVLYFDNIVGTARVTVNDVPFDPLLLAPWRIDITKALKEGTNELSITHTPTLRNRFVGYSRSDKKNHRQYKNNETMPSGLIGRVELRVLRDNHVTVSSPPPDLHPGVGRTIGTNGGMRRNGRIRRKG